MRTIELKGLDKTLYQDILKNGLEIYLLPYEDKKNYYISYATKYGSDILSFMYNKEEYTPPLGVAHYLEHKLFEEESGEDPFTFFSNSGSDGNASTSYDNTQYVVYGNSNFSENLRYLIRFVNNPYFTDENVEKEKGIIAEEIKMYDDIPDYKLEMCLRKNIYHHSPKKNDIAGSVTDIKKITKEDLYNCYNSFYVPNNMFILITGNFDVEEASSIIKEELENKEVRYLPRVLSLKERKEVVKKEEVLYEDIETSKIAYGIKVPKETIPFKGLEMDLYINMLTSILFGPSSQFRDKVRTNKLLNDMDSDWEDDQLYKTFYLFATTTDPDKLIEEIKKVLDKINVTKKDFERIKKVWIANELQMIDSITRTLNNVFDDIIKYNKVIDDRIDAIKNMDMKSMEKLIKEIDLSEVSVVKMINKNNKEIID